MDIKISADTKFNEVQDKFAKAFPYLKVEFYKEKYSENEVSTKDRISSEKMISELVKSFKQNSIDITSSQTVAEVEKEFYEKFGITMQVSRKSGRIWIETSKTDDRTLESQNELGKTMSTDQVDILANDELDRE